MGGPDMIPGLPPGVAPHVGGPVVIDIPPGGVINVPGFGQLTLPDGGSLVVNPAPVTDPKWPPLWVPGEAMPGIEAGAPIQVPTLPDGTIDWESVMAEPTVELSPAEQAAAEAAGQQAAGDAAGEAAGGGGWMPPSWVWPFLGAPLWILAHPTVANPPGGGPTVRPPAGWPPHVPWPPPPYGYIPGPDAIDFWDYVHQIVDHGGLDGVPLPPSAVQWASPGGYGGSWEDPPAGPVQYSEGYGSDFDPPGENYGGGGDFGDPDPDAGGGGDLDPGDGWSSGSGMIAPGGPARPAFAPSIVPLTI